MNAESYKSPFVEKMKHAQDSPSEYSELVDAWNALYERARNDLESSDYFSDVEKYAMATLTDVKSMDCVDEANVQIGRLLNSFPHATFSVDSCVRVSAYNALAFKEYELTSGDRIDDLPFSLPEAVSLSSIVRRSLSAIA